MRSETLVQRNMKELRDAIAALIAREHPIALVNFPDWSDCGQHASWLGTKRFLSDLGITPAYECSAQSYDRAAMAERLRGGTILIHGGFGLGGRQTPGQPFALRVIEDFPANEKILLPHQAASIDDAQKQRAASAMRADAHIHIFVHDSASQKFYADFAGVPADPKRAPDMAFFLGPQERSSEPHYDIVWLARADRASANGPTEAAARLASQAAEKIILPRFEDGIEIHLVVKQRPPTVLLTDWLSLVFENADARLAYQQLSFDAQAQVNVARARHVLSLGQVAITDRLHGHLLCVLMGIPHVLIDDQSGQNGKFYESWTREATLCRIARNPAEAWRLARNALAKLKESGGEFTW